MERKTFSIGMKLLTEYFGPLQNKRAPETKTEALAAMYWQGLKDISDGAFEQAVTESIKHISPHRYDPWPDIKELREFASSYRNPQSTIKASDKVQLPEFTQQQCDSAKSLKWLKDLAGEVVSNTTIPGVRTELDIAKQKEKLRQQAQIIQGVAA